MEDDVIDQGLGLMPQDNSQQDNTQQQTQQPQETQQQESINPAWSELLNVVPEGLRGVVTPHLKKWDSEHQQGIQKVHSQYEPYKPFLESGIAPEDLNNAMLIMQNLEENPEKFARALVEHYGLQLGEQGQESQLEPQELEDPAFDITQHPEFQRVKQGFELLAQQTLSQNELAQEAQAEHELDTKIAAAKEAYGEFDEELVYQRMYALGCDVEEAVQYYKSLEQNIVQNYRPPGANAPRLMGGGGGLPSQAIPVANMTGKERRALMVQTLNNLKASGG